MKKNESKKPLWAQGQVVARKTRKSPGKTAETQYVLFDVETTGFGGDLTVFAVTPKPGKSQRKPNWAKTNDVKVFEYDAEAAVKSRNAIIDRVNMADAMYTDIVENRDPEESLRSAERRYAAALQENDARLKKFMAKHAKPGTQLHTSGYAHVVPDSHFWTDLDMLTQWAKFMPESKEKNHLLVGLKNTKANGYSLVQLGKENAQPVPGTFAKHYDYIRTERIAMTQAEFVKAIVDNRPTKIFCKHWSSETPFYTILAHYDFVQTRARKQTPSVRILNAFENTASRVYLPALYRMLTTENQHRFPFTSLTFQ